MPTLDQELVLVIGGGLLLLAILLIFAVGGSLPDQRAAVASQAGRAGGEQLQGVQGQAPDTIAGVTAPTTPKPTRPPTKPRPAPGRPHPPR
jgi:hypothetical protein